MRKTNLSKVAREKERQNRKMTWWSSDPNWTVKTNSWWNSNTFVILCALFVTFLVFFAFSRITTLQFANWLRAVLKVTK